MLRDIARLAWLILVCTGASARDLVTMVQAKGAGYAISRDEELQQMQSIAQATGTHQTTSRGSLLNECLALAAAAPCDAAQSCISSFPA